MNYLEFRKQLKAFPVFKLSDIRKISEKVYYHRLIDWQKKDLIERLANETYFFKEEHIDEMFLFYAANRIYEHSYVSLESALSFYGFIPEGVYRITSVSTLKTAKFDTSSGIFEYRKIKELLMFGYTLLPYKNVNIRIAEPEKCFIDYFYLNAGVTGEGDFHELRINPDIFLERINRERLQFYLKYINNKKLTQRVNNFLEWFDNAEY